MHLHVLFYREQTGVSTMKHHMFRLIKTCSWILFCRSTGLTNTARMLQYRQAESTAIVGPSLTVLGAMIVAVVSNLAVSQSAADAQGPPQYELTWLGEEGRPRDINEAGVVALSWGASVYDHNSGIKQDLNYLVNAVWTDLETGNPTTEWIAAHASGINESNQVVGTASHVNGTEADRIFVLNDPLGPAPEFQLLPRLNGNQGGFGRYACINDAGVVAGVTWDGSIVVFDPVFDPVVDPLNNYIPREIPGGGEPQEINNSGVIVTRITFEGGYIISPNGNNYEAEYFVDHEFYGINDSGMVSGHRQGKRGKNGWGNGGPIRFDPSYSADPQDLLVSGSAETWFCDVNEFGDVCFRLNGRGFIYIDAADTHFALDQLVVNQDAAWVNAVDVQPTGINDFGQIIGQARVDGVLKGFLLTPIDPGPGGGSQTYSSDDPNYCSDSFPMPIPDNDPSEGAVSTINIPDDLAIDSLTVNLEIDHPRQSDLAVYLTNLETGESAQLSNYTGNNNVTSDFSSSQGTWLLQVYDNRRKRTGDLLGWSVTIQTP
jgi:hypothetical protein